MAATFFRHGEGRSINARIAEGEGKMPLTRATAALAKLAKITRKEAKAALLKIGPCEWHHVGKYAAETDYYDVYVVADFIEHKPKLDLLPADWQEQISDAFAHIQGTPAGAAARDAMCEKFAAVSGLSTNLIKDYYYTLPESK